MVILYSTKMGEKVPSCFYSGCYDPTKKDSNRR